MTFTFQVKLTFTDADHVFTSLTLSDVAIYHDEDEKTEDLRKSNNYNHFTSTLVTYSNNRRSYQFYICNR